MTSKRRPRSKPPGGATADSALRLHPVSWFGWPLAFCGVLGFFGSLRTLQWELMTLWRYTAGTCRIVSSRVVAADGHYRLEVRHQVELDGRIYQSRENTEQDAPTYNDRAEAEARLARSYPVDSIQPCWYDAADPDRHSVLVTEGIYPGRSAAILGISMAMTVAGAWLIRRGVRLIPGTRQA